MDETCSDASTTGPATTRPARRELLRGLAAGVVTAAVGWGDREAAARKKTKRQPLCQRCPNACGGKSVVFCKPLTPTQRCACVKTIGGKSACVNFAGAPPCQPPPGCSNDAECGPGKVCIPTTDGPNCCGAEPNTGNRCMAECF